MIDLPDTPWGAQQREKLERLTDKQAKKKAKKKVSKKKTSE
jgi:hypothetical protein